MFPALLTTLLWSYCLIPARQSVAQIGENAANFWRLFAAVIAMGLISAWGGIALGHEAFGWFFVSGIIGFGFGDIGVWFALPRLGSRLTLLMVHCIAAPLAGLTEWLWLGTTITALQIGSLAIILTGISLALFPDKEREHAAKRRYVSGILFGLLAATGQSIGAVCSRKAFSVLSTDNFQPLDAAIPDYIFLGASSGFVRLTGGILIAGGLWLISRWYNAWKTPPEANRKADPISGKLTNILLCAAAGPILGIICYQWALATTPSVIVQVVVSTSPLVILPLTYFLEHDRLARHSIIGTLIAVGGVVLLALG